MGIGSLLGKLFGGSGNDDAGSAGGGKAVAADSVEFDGYTITPAPIREGGQYRTAGSISRQVEGELKTVSFIRADNHSDQQAAIDHATRKAQQIINEQGLRLFDRENV